MFSVLPESRAKRTRRLGGTVASVVTHAVLIAGAVGLTLTGDAGAVPSPTPIPRPSLTYLIPDQGQHQLSSTSQTVSPVDPTRFHPPTTHVISIDISTTLPPIDYTGPAFDPEKVVIGRGSGIAGAAIGDPGAGAALGSGGSVVGEHDVDRVPHVIGAAPQPRYPETLRAAGIAGHVVLQFVVDTLGRAEPGSVDVQEATRPEFAEAVRAALVRFHFSPGEVGGRKVRTRVQIPFEFSLR